MNEMVQLRTGLQREQESKFGTQVLPKGVRFRLWAPLSEIYGRKTVFLASFTAYVVFSVAAPCTSDIAVLLVLRFFASAFGSSTMTNTGAVIADMFSKAERGAATGLFVTAPFLGPALGKWAALSCREPTAAAVFAFEAFANACFPRQARSPVVSLLRDWAGVGSSVLLRS